MSEHIETIRAAMHISDAGAHSALKALEQELTQLKDWNQELGASVEMLTEQRDRAMAQLLKRGL